ncbi:MULTISPECIES: hypothetical protein [Nitratiruptor]|uniref:DUF2249 domain-containing protein n=1 Tax=Nitratiruptor tergarcus DSM 16512 TaxID=1069081 RepID=A0A1W1WQY8_9BACT|nr:MULTISPECIES: hypothetical protein [Nitratiruptor]BCD63102.1 hypothetical protein NitYY0813_C1990 [Nitratiruptor sp. YY08-13]BCD67037.1 hypothetical protein NitYY0826_C1992 [Nitratiruptor sp. YY08-26]SMC08619.1 hypothetical protein SAMN05660197_0376 [Nitratiruptor tergarcus DSM 16512]
MEVIPQDAQKVEVEGATVDFYKFQKDGVTYYAFDTSRCGPPEPMVNAMAGLKLITSPDVKLIMINHKMPMGLLNKIEENFNIEKENLDDGRVKLVFSYKPGASEKADLADSACHG